MTEPKRHTARTMDRGARQIAALGLVAAAGTVALVAAVLMPETTNAVQSLLPLVPVVSATLAYILLLRPALGEAGAAAATLRAERDGAREHVARLRAERDAAQQAVASAKAAKAAADTRAATKADYLATVSKEVRTPLTGVTGMTELLAETRLDDEQMALVDTVRQSAESLQSVLTNVMDFAALEAGEIELEDAPFDMREVAAKAVAAHLPAATKKGLEIVLDIPPSFAGHCRGDAPRTLQMLSALVGNAVKFTDRGEVCLRLRIKERRGAAMMVVEVTDTGSGLGEGDAERVFEPFVRGNRQASERYGGTGLGLSITRGLARLMKGRVDARATEGGGSRFVLSYPYRVRQTARGSEKSPALDGRRYLVVDDSEAARAVTVAHLTHWGGAAVAVDTVEAAEDRLWPDQPDAEAFDAILLDTSIHGDDASAFAARVAQKAPEVPVLLLVPGDLKAAQTAVEDGLAAACIAKPVLPDALGEALARAAGAASAKSGDRSATAAAPRPAPPGLAPACIILADDNAANRTLIEKFLAEEPMTLIHAPDGVGAVESWADWAPDLILMDVSMPRMDGLEATRRIRAMERAEGLARVPIIALTARAMAEDREKCLEAGMDDYVSKPIRKAELKQKITEWTQSRRKIA